MSPGRFDQYVVAAGSQPKAAELYVWNTRAAGALHEDLGAFEVILRNALDRQLTRYHQIVLSGDGRWYADPRMPWKSKKLADQIDRARAQATRNGRTPEIHGKVIAEATFGVWRYMLAANYQATLWAPALRRAFPHLRSQKREMIYTPVDRLNALRNRIAHHEPVHHQNLEARHKELLRVAGWIDPAAAAWIAETSRVKQVLVGRP
ncbi:conserved hypothetical protein [Streptomyces sp. SPB074]|nr:conserved hypothetical protein [Streptomyces sp. SPB074]